MTLRIGINGKEFDIIIVLRRNYLSNEKERINRTIYYQCNEWRDLQGEAGAKMINVISQVEKVLSGEEYDAEIQKRQLGMETAQQAIEYLQTQVGNGFPKQAELEAAEERIAELEEQMKKMFFQGEISFNDEVYITNARHKQALLEAKKSLELTAGSIEMGMPEDFFSIDLMNAYEELGSIIGEAVGEDLVNEIFSKFCTGK